MAQHTLLFQLDSFFFFLQIHFEHSIKKVLLVKNDRNEKTVLKNWIAFQWLPTFLRGPVVSAANPAMQSSLRTLCRRQTSKGSGVTVMPTFPWRLGSDAPAGNVMSNVCRSELKKRKSSIRARTSPKHMRLPTPNGMKYSGLQTLPSADRKRSGRNSAGSSHNSGSMCTACNRGTTCAPVGIVKPFIVTSLLTENEKNRIKYFFFAIKNRLLEKLQTSLN